MAAGLVTRTRAAWATLIVMVLGGFAAPVLLERGCAQQGEIAKPQASDAADPVGKLSLTDRFPIDKMSVLTPTTELVPNSLTYGQIGEQYLHVVHRDGAYKNPKITVNYAGGELRFSENFHQKPPREVVGELTAMLAEVASKLGTPPPAPPAGPPAYTAITDQAGTRIENPALELLAKDLPEGKFTAYLIPEARGKLRLLTITIAEQGARPPPPVDPVDPVDPLPPGPPEPESGIAEKVRAAAAKISTDDRAVEAELLAECFSRIAADVETRTLADTPAAVTKATRDMTSQTLISFGTANALAWKPCLDEIEAIVKQAAQIAPLKHASVWRQIAKGLKP